MLDHEGCLALFERVTRTATGSCFRPDGCSSTPRRSAPTERGKAGKSGRRKLCVVDWDGDGKLDLLLNCRNARLFRQVDFAMGSGTSRTWARSEPEHRGPRRQPHLVDFNADGLPDFLGGAEDGRFYYLRNPRAR